MRRGTTLIELMVGIVLLGVMAAFAATSVHQLARVARGAVTDAGRHRSALTLQQLLRHDLGDAVDGDIASVTGPSMTYRRPVGAAPACNLSGSRVLIDQAAWDGARLPVAGRDSALVLDDLDGTWSAASVLGVAGATCGGRPALALTLDRAITYPVVRVIEPVRLALYSSAGAEWLGLASSGGAIQPLAGPVTPSASPWLLAPRVLAATVLLPGAFAPTTLRVVLPTP